MLRQLCIENYALIERLTIEFGSGLTVITGETGAGKSILLGALSLIIGQRADTQVLNDPTRKCIIEGSFDIDNDRLESLFHKYDLDVEPISIFRREISPQGRSRAFVNDTPVSLQVLKELAEKIIDIHSQHQNLLLGESLFQFDVVDNFAGMLPLAGEYRQEFAALQKRKRDLVLLEEQEMKLKTDLDYYQFQYEELSRAALNESSFAEWESEIEIIRHAEEIRNGLEKARYLLADSEVNVTVCLHDILQEVRSLAKYGHDYEGLLARLESVAIEIKDITHEAEKLSERVLHDPERASELEARLDAISRLFLKHHVGSVDELIRIREHYKEKINSIYSLEEQINAEKDEIAKDEARLTGKAGTMSAAREKAIPRIEKEIVGLLKVLGMPGAQLRITKETSSALTSNGIDRIEFLFSANQGSEVREISKVASGGELSRLMLCIKSLLSRHNLLPTIIFDEIDTGISGKIGGTIGEIMQHMSAGMQVIAITHLPQIAARGSHQLLVFKEVENNKTRTYIKPLNGDERITQLARMLGGDHPTTSMIETAKELLYNK